METIPQTFTTPLGKNVRVVMVEGEPWFVAKDVCEALGLAGNFNSIRTLTTDERKALDKRTCPDHALFPGTTARINTISESGLYKLVMRSDKPQALAFQNWVTKEVLPAIRKDGAYVIGEEKVKAGNFYFLGKGSS